jgi:ABC-type glycerol-3-phosphate transport system substrate-binding protein
MSKLKYILEDLKWLKVLNSPFKPFRVRLYAGKTQVGIPYFLPRKWVKATPELAKKAALNTIQSEKSWNDRNSKYARKIKSYEEIYQEKLTYTFPVPLKVGFSYCGLGWKTKWTDTDFRYEWGPVLSFVFFGYQIALMVGHKDVSHYWEAWLYYEYATDKTKSKRERIEQCRKEFPQTWKVSFMGKEEIVDYYQRILKTKYL